MRLCSGIPYDGVQDNGPKDNGPKCSFHGLRHPSLRSASHFPLPTTSLLRPGRRMNRDGIPPSLGERSAQWPWCLGGGKQTVECW